MANSPIDIVKVFYGTLSLMSAEKAGMYLAPEFTLAGLTKTPLGKEAWVAFLQALKTALPDLKIRLSNVTAQGNEVRFTEAGVGHHRERMDMSLLSQPDIPASGLEVLFFPSDWLLTIAGGKIIRAELVSPPSHDTGLPGMLKAFAAKQLIAN